MTRSQLGRSLSLAALAFVIAAVAQFALTQPPPGLGWSLYALAAVLFIVSLVGVQVARFALGKLDSAPSRARRELNYRPVPLVLSLLSAAGGVVLFGQQATAPAAWGLYLFSLLLFIAAFIRLGPRTPERRTRRLQIGKRVLGWLPITGVLAIAAVPRLWELARFPFGEWYDEAVNGLIARQLLADTAFRPVYLDATQMTAHFNYLIALSFRFFGVTPWALRLVPAAFGIAGVLFAFLLFRRWFGPGIGALAAVVLAVMRYDLTFSRFGTNGICTPAFELAALYFLDRAAARKKSSDFAWLGVTIGLGLGFYIAFRLFLIVLALFAVGLVIAAIARHGWRATLKRYGKALSTQWIVAALGLAVAVAPVAQLAFRRPDQFLARSNTVSIFEKRDQPDLAKALWSNTLKHLEMFNLHGDSNGRHNLPGIPMLDPIMGALFVLGLAYVVWNWRHPPNALMLLVFIIMLLAGILSLDFEAPQSYRAIGVIPALVYFISVPVAGASRLVTSLLEARKPPAGWGISQGIWNVRYGIGASSLVALMGIIAAINLYTFFVSQQNDPSAWASYSTPETIVANEINQNASTDDFVLSTLYYDPPSVRFLVSKPFAAQEWTATDRLPLVRDKTDRGVIMMFDETLLSAYRDAQRYYPNAQFIEHHAPAGGGTVMYEVVLSPRVLQSVQGADVRYFVGDTVAGQPVKQEVVKQLAVDWSQSQPLATSYVAEVRSTLLVPAYGDYRFFVHGDPAGRLWIDGFPTTESPVTLARGNHAVLLVVPGGASKTEVWWQPPQAPEPQAVPSANLFRPPVTNNGLLGAYYRSPDLMGTPAFTQIDPEIAFYFHIIPLPRPYSVQWTGKLLAPTSGSYDFELYSVDGSQLTLDNNVVVDNPIGRTTVKNSVELTPGWHDIMIHFSDQTSATQIYFYWTPPGATQRVLVPSENLLPPMGQYPPAP
jgi:hypothetical protein